MKVKRKSKATLAVGLDTVKTHKLKSSLQQVSFEQRAKEIGAPTTIKLNVKGNRRGMHVAGDSEQMKRIRAMRRLWNAKMPVMHCNNCSLSQQCPQYKAGYECAFNRFFDSHAIQSEEDLLFYAKELCTQSMKRAQKMLLAETLSGGVPSLETSESLSIVFAQLMQLHDRVTETAELQIESATNDNSIIGRLFGGLDGLMQDTSRMLANPIEVPGSSAEATLVEDAGVRYEPESVGAPPQREASAELVRAFNQSLASSNQGAKNE